VEERETLIDACGHRVGAVVVVILSAARAAADLNASHLPAPRRALAMVRSASRCDRNRPASAAVRMVSVISSTLSSPDAMNRLSAKVCALSVWAACPVHRPADQLDTSKNP
jgi:hypothetical protein